MLLSNCISQPCVHSSKIHSFARVTLVALLSLALVTTGCSAQWLNVALTDLPVLTQMALNITMLVTTLQSGKQSDPTAISAIQNISSEATQDLALLQPLYNQYRSNPNAGTLQKIQQTIAKITQNLPALLQAARISDPVTSARVSSGVNLIVTTVASISALMPQSTPSTSQSAVKISIPTAKELKNQWNQQICGTIAGCVVR